MARVKHAKSSHKRKKKVLKKAKGYWLDRSKRFRHAKEAVMKALVYAYRDRKVKKREIRALWIARINAACKENGLTYNKFIKGLKSSKIALDRKILADIAVNDPKVFSVIVKQAKNS